MLQTTSYSKTQTNAQTNALSLFFSCLHFNVQPHLIGNMDALVETVTEKLSASGELSDIKARLRAAVFQTLDKDGLVERKAQSDLKSFLTTQDGQDAFGFVLDFLKSFELSFTEKVLLSEADINVQRIPNRPPLSSRYHLPSQEHQPLIAQLIKTRDHPTDAHPPKLTQQSLDSLSQVTRVAQQSKELLSGKGRRTTTAATMAMVEGPGHLVPSPKELPDGSDFASSLDKKQPSKATSSLLDDLPSFAPAIPATSSLGFPKQSTQGPAAPPSSKASQDPLIADTSTTQQTSYDVLGGSVGGMDDKSGGHGDDSQATPTPSLQASEHAKSACDHSDGLPEDVSDVISDDLSARSGSDAGSLRSVVSAKSNSSVSSRLDEIEKRLTQIAALRASSATDALRIADEVDQQSRGDVSLGDDSKSSRHLSHEGQSAFAPPSNPKSGSGDAYGDDFEDDFEAESSHKETGSKQARPSSPLLSNSLASDDEIISEVLSEISDNFSGGLSMGSGSFAGSLGSIERRHSDLQQQTEDISLFSDASQLDSHVSL
eukprot:m.14031 g.14031  ORF g.14031 m.14031 type:complete len:544 (-) comp6118_c0_seq2:236-1867(-)